MRKKKTWKEKLATGKEASIVPVPPRMQARLGTGTLLIPRPLDVDGLIRKVPEGRLLTVGEIRRTLAAEAGATTTCPLVTGIFIWLSAEASNEAEQAGGAGVTPWWRVVRDDGTLMEKLPGGAPEQARRLKREGHKVAAKGKHMRVDLTSTAGT